MKKISRRKPWFLWAVVIGSFIAAVIFVVGWNRISAEREYGSEAVSHVRSINAEDHILAGKGTVEVIVYSDPECSYCKHFHENVLPRLRSEFGESAVFAYRHFLLPRFARSYREAVALECAAEVGGNVSFNEYLNELFRRTPSEDRLDPAELSRIAEYVRLPAEEFGRCFNQDAHPGVDEDRVEAALAGVSITPTFIVRGGGIQTMVVGSWHEPIRAAIRQALGTVSPQPTEALDDDSVY